jgi:type III secretory pathway component EscU
MAMLALLKSNVLEPGRIFNHETIALDGKNIQNLQKVEQLFSVVE